MSCPGVAITDTKPCNSLVGFLLDVDVMYGPRFKISAHPNAFVGAVKHEIARAIGIPTEYQILCTGGAEMADDRPLSTYATCDVLAIGVIANTPVWWDLDATGSSGGAYSLNDIEQNLGSTLSVPAREPDVAALFESLGASNENDEHDEAHPQVAQDHSDG